MPFHDPVPSAPHRGVSKCTQLTVGLSPAAMALLVHVRTASHIHTAIQHALGVAKVHLQCGHGAWPAPSSSHRPAPKGPGSEATLQPALAQCLISKIEGLWSRMARIILSMYCLSRKLISSCSFRASISSSRDAVSISAARDWALVWVAKRFFAS